jgi:polar amino acid transport system permease protein
MSDLLRLFFDRELILESLPSLLREGLLNTLYISAGSIVVGLVIGLILSLVAISERWWIRLPAVVYIDIFRGLPSILTVVLIGLGLHLAGFDVFGRNQFAYGILALGLISAAYVAEIFRAGIQSIDKGQMEAARSLGLSHLAAMRLVVVPQAVRRVLPPLTNEFILLVKDSSLLFVLGLSLGDRDLFRVGQNLAQQTANYTPVVAAGFVYLLITIPLTRLVNYLDKRLREGKSGVEAGEDLPTTAQVQA